MLRVSHNTVDIYFSPHDMLEAKRIANERNDIKVANGIPSNLFAGHKYTDSESHEVGVMAEMAVAFYLQTQVDKTFTIHGDGGKADLNKDGTDIEVKYTSRGSGDFIIPNSDPNYFQSDVGILVTPSMTHHHLRLTRWITKSRFMEKFQLRDYTKGPRASVTQADMYQMDALKLYLEKGQVPSEEGT